MSESKSFPKIRNSDLIVLFEKLDDIIYVINFLSNKLELQNNSIEKFTEQNLFDKKARNVILNHENSIKNAVYNTVKKMILIQNESLKKTNFIKYKTMIKDLDSNNKDVFQKWIREEGGLSLYLNTDNEKLSKFLNEKNSLISRIIKMINMGMHTFFYIIKKFF
uniref:Uncharacterized protein n=1 Tax=Strongyloides stercoralis TaxID=6248 RepID=A0AAF5DTA0_STRER